MKYGPNAGDSESRSSWKEDFSRYLDANPPKTLDKEEAGTSVVGSFSKVPIGARIDLHGYTLTPAIAALDRFMKECFASGVEKILVIHGKGSHEGSEGVLRREIRRYLEVHPLAGERREAPRELGGSGALIVRLRLKKKG